MKLDLDEYLAERTALVDRYLDHCLPPEDRFPESLHRAVRYSLFAGGKRLRPILVLGAAEAVGGSVEEALPAAAALEMIHCYSLIHDDLPAMDDDSLRRGKPTSHVVFGEAIAILAGDALLTEAFRLLAASPSTRPAAAERRLRAIAVLAEAAGLSGMISGQVVDLESEGRPAENGVLDFIHLHKTGALMGAATQLGALLAGGGEEETAIMARFGREIGLAFQIVDDILDVEGESATLGKSAGKDERSGKITYPSLHGLELSRRRAGELVEHATRLVSAFGARGEPLARIARWILERRS